ncbi:MAG: DUF1192 domain-containing protein [Alphaproteobacteria bacterium]|nr:DUF1192 domain-containing protein [Alphaproteobacteria bacterium]
MLDSDEVAPQKAPAIALPRPLDKLSVDELEAYIRTLEEERGRVKAEIAKKLSARSGADAVFGS